MTISDKSVLISIDEYKQKYPLTWAYLEECKERLSARNKGKMGKDWHGYVYKKNHTRFDSPKILVPSLATGSCFSPDLEGKYYFVGSGGGGGGGYGISLSAELKLSYLYLLGILNSKLLSEYLKSISTAFQHGYIALNRQYIEQLPIRAINFADPAERAQHDQIVSLVERMLALTPLLSPLPSPRQASHRDASQGGSQASRTPQEREAIVRQIEATDRAIDKLVYELYGLSPEEIAIVEGKN